MVFENIKGVASEVQEESRKSEVSRGQVICRGNGRCPSLVAWEPRIEVLFSSRDSFGGLRVIFKVKGLTRLSLNFFSL